MVASATMREARRAHRIFSIFSQLALTRSARNCFNARSDGSRGRRLIINITVLSLSAPLEMLPTAPSPTRLRATLANIIPFEARDMPL
jgi:hypothetical protein